MKKEYALICCYYIDGEPYGKYGVRSYSLEEIEGLYRKKLKKEMRKKRKRYTYEIMERTVTDWINRDCDNVLGFN